MGRFEFVMGRFGFGHGAFCRLTGRGSVLAARFATVWATRTLPLPSLYPILYFPLTSTGFDCVAAFVSLPALSAVWWDCVITAMPGMPNA